MIDIIQTAAIILAISLIVWFIIGLGQMALRWLRNRPVNAQIVDDLPIKRADIPPPAMIEHYENEPHIDRNMGWMWWVALFLFGWLAIDTIIRESIKPISALLIFVCGSYFGMWVIEKTGNKMPGITGIKRSIKDRR